jgi:autotransporter-associated beta strand protein
MLIPPIAAQAATFHWTNTTANWNSPASWSEGVQPLGIDATDVLMFGGDVNAPYIATNNLPAVPALINRLVFDATNSANLANTQTIAGSPIAFGGATPQIIQNNLGSIAINVPIELRAPLILAGNGGVVSINGRVAGVFDIHKEDSSTFRFGSLGVPLSTTWTGRMTINSGAIGLSDFSTSISALRANPVTLSSTTARLTTSSELRVGTLSGPAGLVESRVVGPDTNNQDIVIHAIDNGIFEGTLRLAPPTGTGRNTATLIIRGAAKQTLTGMSVSPDSPPGANALQIEKDIAIGHGATLSLSGNASLSQQTAGGAIVMAGGEFELDNRASNNPNRLRDGDSGSTGLDSAGGGLFTLIGNALGTTELISRLQLGSPSNARSGALTIRVVHNAGTSAATQLLMQSLSRDGFARTFTTVNFEATDGAGNEIPLGQPGAAPRIGFVTAPLLANGLLRNTRNFDPETVGWATVNGSAFATHGPNGIAPVALTPAPAGISAGDPAANIEILSSFIANNSNGYAVNSLRLAPSAPGEQFELQNGGDLRTNALLLAGPFDYTVLTTTNGGLAGAAPASSNAAARYVHVESATLTLGLRLDGTFLPIVKSGEGTLVLNHPGNINSFAPMIINAGVLRANIATTTLPIGELQFRGGVLELTGGGTFSRTIGYGAFAVNWIGVDEFNQQVDQDQGSGGFAALGANANIDLNGAGPSVIEWESRGFVESGHALIFGSRSADHIVTWTDNLGLTSTSNVPNYNAREIRVLDNPTSAGDRARFTGTIAGGFEDDLLKTGAGTLELSVVNSYQGATIVREGTLLINAPGSIATSFLTDVHDGATLGGNGTVGPLRIQPGGRLAPAGNLSNTGSLASGDITLQGPDAQLSVEIGGRAPGLFDQIVVTGSISLNGADLTGALINGFNPTPSDLFFIMLNDGTDSVNGTFAQGQLITISNVPFQIFYTADSATNSTTGGNDVGVRLVPEPSAWLFIAAGIGITTMLRRRKA